MKEIFKSIVCAIPAIVEFINKYKAWGWAILVLVALACITSGYALNEEETMRDSVQEIQRCIDAEKASNTQWREYVETRMNSLESKLDVQGGKLDLLVSNVNSLISRK